MVTGNQKSELPHPSAKPLVGQVAVVGLGLMGGSLGLALKRRGVAGRICGYARRPETRSLALEWEAADQVFDRPEAAVAGSDLVVFCTPVGTIPELAQACLPAYVPGAVVTDVGSTKAELVKKMGLLFQDRQVYFIGSHPIAGSELQGLESARANLYEDAVVVVTRAAGTHPAALAKVQTFWQALGARVRTTSPEEHDRLLARTSHVPHLIAAVLASSVGRNPTEPVRDFCGTGFLDTTRIAEGSPDLWRDIIHSNRAAIRDELKAFQKEMDMLVKLMKKGDCEDVRCFLEESRSRRRRLTQGRS